MSATIDAIVRTRKIASDILTESLKNIEGLSEVKIREKILTEIKKHTNIFPEGYYNPPPFGTVVLADQKPFKRLKYDSLRNPDFWSKENSFVEKESVVMIYLSPVDRKTNMIGDIGLTIYAGNNQEIKKHIKKSYNATLSIAKHAEVGMTFSELCEFAKNLFEGSVRPTKWIAISSDPNQTMNLGHTIPGSFEDNLFFGNTFEEIKENIRVKRIPFIDTENFKIPATCAFTVESRLEDFNNPDLPSVHFHFMVCFDKKKKIILENYDKIFSMVGMDYMNK